MHNRISREEAREMSAAHAEGWHSPADGVPREGCPDCEGRELRSYPTHVELELEAERSRVQRVELERDRADLREIGEGR